MTSDRVRRYVMIGAPVTSVRTPPLLEAFLAGESAPARVDVQHLEPGDLAVFMDSVRADRGIDGLMVTMPHKRAILDHLDGVSGVAAASGSVNAVKRAEDGLLGAQFVVAHIGEFGLVRGGGGLVRAGAIEFVALTHGASSGRGWVKEKGRRFGVKRRPRDDQSAAERFTALSLPLRPCSTS